MNLYVQQSIAQHAYDKLIHLTQYLSDIDKSELHHELFNTDYFVIGYHNASEWIREMGLSAWDVLNKVRDYEETNFGALNTDSNSEAMVNMLAYILGEELLNSLDSFSNCEETVTKSDMFRILEELKILISGGTF